MYKELVRPEGRGPPPKVAKIGLREPLRTRHRPQVTGLSSHLSGHTSQRRERPQWISQVAGNDHKPLKDIL